MSLIGYQTPAEEATAYIKLEIKQAVDRLEGAVASCFQRFWQDPNGATAQQILDEFNTNAGLLLATFEKSKELINLIEPNRISLEGPGITVNQDGTATVNTP